MVYIFTDGQIIANDTPCFKLELSQLLKKYYFLNMDTVAEEMQNGQQDTSRLANLQIEFYKRAVREVLSETTLAFQKEH